MTVHSIIKKTLCTRRRFFGDSNFPFVSKHFHDGSEVVTKFKMETRDLKKHLVFFRYGWNFTARWIRKQILFEGKEIYLIWMNSCAFSFQINDSQDLQLRKRKNSATIQQIHLQIVRVLRYAKFSESIKFIWNSGNFCKYQYRLKFYLFLRMPHVLNFPTLFLLKSVYPTLKSKRVRV